MDIKILAAGIILAATWGTVCAAEGYTNFCYGSTDPAQQALWGTSKLEAYDVAMKIVDPAMSGKTVTCISVPVVECEGISDYSIWLTNELTIATTDEGKVNSPDIASFDCTPVNGCISVELAEPVTIPADGLYVGYSFKMTELGAAETAPLVVKEFTVYPESFFLHTNRTYKAWKNLSDKEYVSPVINVVVTGDFSDNSLEVIKLGESHLLSGHNGEVDVTVHNNGGNPVSNLHYTIALQEGSILAEGIYELPEPIEPAVYERNVISLPVEASSLPGTPGQYGIEVSISKVNGETNATSDNVVSGYIHEITFIPTHKPVLEEYTGTWCGYCPRGYVGLEIMNHLYPEDFIGISYHSGDAMEVVPQSDYPNEIIGYPDAWIDRVEQTDAYSGRNDESNFGIDKVWQIYRNVIAPADINVKAAFTDAANTAITVEAQTIFAKKVSGKSYREVFMLLGNGMSNERWFQANNYAGSKIYDNSPYRDFWAQFVDGGANVRGVVYNDILLACSNVLGEGNELPEDFKLDEPVLMNHTFNIADVVNVNGEPIIQDTDKLYAVVLLVDEVTGRVENANKVKVSQSAGVNSIETAGKNVTHIYYYDLTGRCIAGPADGIYIVRTVYEDGSMTTEKRIGTIE